MVEQPANSAGAGGLVPTGIPGLDQLLQGGLPGGYMYLVEGDSGSGKTTLALQFLIEGRARGEKVLFLTLSETKAEIEGIARSHKWSLSGIEVHEVLPEDVIPEEQQQTVFAPVEVELNEFRARVTAILDRVKPTRAVIDSLAELRILSGDIKQYRKQVAHFKRAFGARGCTLLLTDDNTAEAPPTLLHSLSHGVLKLTNKKRKRGEKRRKCEIVKVRALSFDTGPHDYEIRTGGVVIFPRLRVPVGSLKAPVETLSSGVPGLDALLDKGVYRGTCVALLGPSGIGKTTTALQYVLHNANRGYKAEIFLFDERTHTLMLNAVGRRLVDATAAGEVRIREIAAGELSPGAFAVEVRQAVERGVDLVVIDGLAGYVDSMPEDPLLREHLHGIVGYLKACNVTTFLLVNQATGMPPALEGELHVSYLADTIILFRNYEYRAEIHRALSVLQHRGARLERTLREVMVTHEGLAIGAPLEELRGVLTGPPWLRGEHDAPPA